MLRSWKMLANEVEVVPAVRVQCRRIRFQIVVVPLIVKWYTVSKLMLDRKHQVRVVVLVLVLVLVIQALEFLKGKK